VRDLAHHGEGRPLHVGLQISCVGEDVEPVAQVVSVFSEGEVFGAESFDTFPHLSSTFHHGSHGFSVRDVRVRCERESKLNNEKISLF